MENNTDITKENEIKEYSSSPIVVGVLSIIGGLIMPLLGYIFSIPGMVSAGKRKKADPKDNKAKTGHTLCVVGLIISIIVHFIGVAMRLG